MTARTQVVRRRRARVAAVLSLSLAATLLPASRAAAHDATAVVRVPRLSPADEPPVVDGVCTQGYGPGGAFTLLFRPRLDRDFALGLLTSTETDLYLCIRGIPAGFRGPSSVVFGFDHSHRAQRGTPSLSAYEIRLGEDGALSVRGGSQGWNRQYPQARIPEFVPEARIFRPSEFTWNAELRITGARHIGWSSAAPWGFSVRAADVRSRGDDYALPRDSLRDESHTWGDLQWDPLGSGRTRGDLGVHAVRITQGMDYDAATGEPYALVANKPTLVRTWLWMNWSFRFDRAECFLRHRASGRRDPVRVIVRGSLGTWGVRGMAGPFVDCWVPPSAVEEPGIYDITMGVFLRDEPERTWFTLGTRTFFPSPSLRAYVHTREVRPSDPFYRRMGADLTLASFLAVDELARRYPLQGADPGRLDTGNGPGSAGLRWLWSWRTSVCVPQADEDPADTDARCYTEALADGQNGARNVNRYLALLERALGRRTDRIDTPYVATARTSSLGGQAAWVGRSCVPTGELTRDAGMTATIMGQEIAHCYDHLLPDSPHVDSGGAHTGTWQIPLIGAREHVQLFGALPGYDRPGAISMMNGGVAAQPNTYLQGWDYNRLMGGLGNPPAAIRRFRGDPGSAKSAGDTSSAGNARAGLPIAGVLSGELPFGPGPAPETAAAEPRQVVLTGIVDPNGFVRPTYSGLVTEAPYPLTPSEPGSHAVIFTDAGGAFLGQVGFDLTRGDSVKHDPDAPDPWLPYFVAAEVPSRTRRISIVSAGVELHRIDVSARAPSFAFTSAKHDTGREGIDLQWSASDPDGDALTYNVYLAVASGPIPQLIAQGVREPHLFLQPDLVPAGPGAHFIIEASDGFNTARAVTDPIAIPERPPIVGITGPEETGELVAGQPIVLRASGLDITTGALEPSAFTWTSSRDGALGTGGELQAPLSPGVHDLVVVGTAPSGLSATDVRRVRVLADADGDGLPDGYETFHACTDASVADSGDDHDADGASSFAEHQAGTDPCEPDADADGYGDGEELLAGSDPLGGLSWPAPQVLYLDDEEIDLGRCPGVTQHVLPVVTGADDTAWTATSSGGLLEVSGGGPGDNEITIEADCASLPDGEVYRDEVVVHAPGGLMRTVPVIVRGPDTTPPSTTITTADNEVLLRSLYPGQAVRGVTTDAGAGVERVAVTFTPELPGLGTQRTTHAWLTCEPLAVRCEWYAQPPESGVARYRVSVRAFDRAGNVEDVARRISILVIDARPPG